MGDRTDSLDVLSTAETRALVTALLRKTGPVELTHRELYDAQDDAPAVNIWVVDSVSGVVTVELGANPTPVLGSVVE